MQLRKNLAFALLTTLLLATQTGITLAQGINRATRQAILPAVVKIIPYDMGAGELVDWSGSGTIISPSGHVLTNYHVAGDTTSRTHHEWHLIFMTDMEFTDREPEPTFWARYVAGDPTHDLALLKIEEWLDETPVESSFRFPHVNVGDSNSLIPGDHITIIGYPGISGSTITLTAGIMSGWVGEDFDSGGKQWIKTDGKISHGNSGGGAFDENGDLIGVPTAGRTHRYDALDIEEQAYVRPVSLAWALIGPHVADVARSPNIGMRASAGASAATATPGGTQASMATNMNCDQCTVGTLELEQRVSNVITSNPDYVNYHTYRVEVPAGTQSVTFNLVADFDLDIAIRHGEDVTNWGGEGDWDYQDLSEAFGAAVTIPHPAAGAWHVDVITFYSEGETNYEFFASVDPQARPEFECDQCIVRTLTLGDVVTNALPGREGYANYHTYLLEVPRGTPEMTIDLVTSGHLDVVMRHGAQIEGWSDEHEWDYRENTQGNGVSFRVPSPQPGTWYLDIVNYSAGGRPNYTLTTNTPGVTAGGSQPTSAAAEPCSRCTVGTLAFTETASSVITGNPDYANYHTYELEVPAGLPAMSIALTADSDLGIAVRYGAQITGWGEGDDWDYLDISAGKGATFEVPNPRAGTWYIDVINLADDGVASYVLTSGLAAGAHSASGVTLGATCDRCDAGTLSANDHVSNVIRGLSGNANYHSYQVQVPAGVPALTVALTGDGDVDIVVRYGAQITGWGDGDDWEYRDMSSDPGGAFKILSPQAGTWYVDVINLHDSDVSYELKTVTGDG